MLESITVWRNAFKNLPKVIDDSWAKNMADEVSSLVDSKLVLEGLSPDSTFTFAKEFFKNSLLNLPNAPTASQGGQNFANAWATAVSNASTSMLVPSGATSSATPATTFSAPPTVLVNPVVAVSQTLALSLGNIPLNDDGGAFGEAFRDAFLGLTFNVSGINSLSTPTALVFPTNGVE